jgi:hypothetical protein
MINMNNSCPFSSNFAGHVMEKNMPEAGRADPSLAGPIPYLAYLSMAEWLITSQMSFKFCLFLADLVGRIKQQHGSDHCCTLTKDPLTPGAREPGP